MFFVAHIKYKNYAKYIFIEIIFFCKISINFLFFWVYPHFAFTDYDPFVLSSSYADIALIEVCV